MDEGARIDYLKEVQTTSVLDKIVKTGYKALCLECFFTAGKDEVRAWTIQVFIILLIYNIIFHRKALKHHKQLAKFIQILKNVLLWLK